MENVNLDFWTLIQQGAISTYPLLLCSVLVLGVAEPVVGDPDATREPDLAVHDEQLAMGAIVHP